MHSDPGDNVGVAVSSSTTAVQNRTPAVMPLPTTPFQINNTVTADQASVVPELRAAAAAILDSDHGIRVLFMPHRVPRRTTWVILARADETDPERLHVGTLQYTGPFDGYGVGFAIRPDRTTGSSLLVSVPGTEAHNSPGRDPGTLDEVVQCAVLATAAEHKNFAVGQPLPNHGPEHFAWLKNLTEIIIDKED